MSQILTCHVSHVHSLAYPTVRRNIRYSLFIRRVHFVLHTIHLLLQASVFPFVCVPEECTLRGELLRKVADMLRSPPVIQTLVLQQQVMAASLGPGHAQAVARAGTLKTSTFAFYILLDEEERT